MLGWLRIRIIVNDVLVGRTFANCLLDLLKSNIIQSDFIALLFVRKKVSLHNYESVSE
jgi:hypothetical protein